MSMSLMAKAMNIKVGNPIRKLVFLKLADNANDKGECWPSYQHIAEACETSRRSVIAHIDTLRMLGFVQKIYRSGEKGNSSNVYILTLGGADASLPSELFAPDGGEKIAPPSENYSPRVVQEIHYPGASGSLPPSESPAPRTSHSFESVIEPKTTHTLLLSQDGNISLKERLIEMLKGKFVCDSASELHDQVEEVILNSSLACKREAFVDERGDGVRGRVDLLVSDSLGSVCGIEIDRASPRQKSLFKLEQLPAGLVLLRDGDAERFDCGEITVINARPTLQNKTIQLSRHTGKKTKFDPLTQKPDNVSAEVWADWVEHRREIRHALTPTTCKRIKSMLENHVNPDAVINLSIERGWQGLFPEKITEPAKTKPAFNMSRLTPEQRQEFALYEFLEGR